MKKSLALFLFLFLWFLSAAAYAETYEVTNCSSFSTVEGSLPWAVEQANASFYVVDINFNIPTSETNYITTESGGNFFRIPLTSPLVLRHNGIFIHGSSQEVAKGNKNLRGPDIELTKDSTTSLDAIIKLQSVNSCTIEGLAINNSLGSGIWISFSNKCTIKNCYIGTTPTGEAARPNALNGISFEGATLNIIGGDTTFESNIISGNGANGLYFSRSTVNKVKRNLIGTNTNEARLLGNGGSGILIETDSYGQTIEANTIAGNGSAAAPYGVKIDGSGSRYNALLQNLVYSNYGSGIKLLGNANEGISPPEIVTAEAYTLSGRTFISGLARPGSHVEIFEVETTEALSAGQGKYFLGSTEANTSGEWLTYVPFNTQGRKICAVQTDSKKNSSEFSTNKGPITTAIEYRPDAEISPTTFESAYIGLNVINGTGFMQTVSKSTIAGQKAIYYARAKNTGTTSESLIITGTNLLPTWEVKYFDATAEGNDITGLATTDGWRTGILPTGESVNLRIETKALISQIMTGRVLITATSSHDAVKKDVVCMTTVTTLPPQAVTSINFTTPQTATAKDEFLITVEARDITQNITTDVNETTYLTIDFGTISPATIDAAAFGDTGSVEIFATIEKAGKRNISAVCGSATGAFSIIMYNATQEFSDASLGVTITIPKGAATEELNISISGDDNLPGPPPAGKWQAGKAITFSSNVPRFLIPAMVTLPLYSGATEPTGYFWTGSSWSRDQVTTESHTIASVNISTLHLSVFAPFQQAQASQFIFGPSPFNPTKDGTAYFWYWLNAEKSTKLCIYDINGNLVVKKEFQKGTNGGKGGINTVAWDGKNAFGERLSSGVYQYQIIQGGTMVGKNKLVIFNR